MGVYEHACARVPYSEASPGRCYRAVLSLFEQRFAVPV